MVRGLVTAMLLFTCTGWLSAQTGDGRFQVREDDGGSLVVRTASGLVNQNTSLKRRWLAVDDVSCPARLNRTGVFTRFDEKEQVHFLMPFGTATPKQGISAIEVRYLLFDVWGQHLRTLGLTRLIDTSTNVDLREGSGWPAWESEASQLVTVVAFVSRVRTAEGRVWEFAPETMAQQIQSLGLSATVPDLTPNEQSTPSMIYWTYPPMQARPAAGSVHP